MTTAASTPFVLALAGGVGGAKLAHGLAQALPPAALTVVVNTGDDFEHLGFSISPDLDTVMYTLAGLADRERGWGLAGETWRCMEALERLGGETWFRLGDRDLATHIERSRRLRAGETLSQITASLCQHLGVRPRILPMSDGPFRTELDTDQGWLDFQTYFVRRRAEPAVRGIRFAHAPEACPSPSFRAALHDPALRAIVLCPSNPLLSILPILELPGVRAALRARSAPTVAVSPLIAGRALKGPAAKILRELGQEANSRGIAVYYGALIDGLVLDRADTGLAHAIEALGTRVLVTDTLMQSDADRLRLAEETLAFAEGLAVRADARR